MEKMNEDNVDMQIVYFEDDENNIINVPPPIQDKGLMLTKKHLPEIHQQLLDQKLGSFTSPFPINAESQAYMQYHVGQPSLEYITEGEHKTRFTNKMFNCLQKVELPVKLHKKDGAKDEPVTGLYPCFSLFVTDTNQIDEPGAWKVEKIGDADYYCFVDKYTLDMLDGVIYNIQSIQGKPMQELDGNEFYELHIKTGNMDQTQTDKISEHDQRESSSDDTLVLHDGRTAYIKPIRDDNLCILFVDVPHHINKDIIKKVAEKRFRHEYTISSMHKKKKIEIDSVVHQKVLSKMREFNSKMENIENKDADGNDDEKSIMDRYAENKVQLLTNYMTAEKAEELFAPTEIDSGNEDQIIEINLNQSDISSEQDIIRQQQRLLEANSELDADLKSEAYLNNRK